LIVVAFAARFAACSLVAICVSQNKRSHAPTSCYKAGRADDDRISSHTLIHARPNDPTPRSICAGRTSRQFLPISGPAASISSLFRFASAGAWRHLACVTSFRLHGWLDDWSRAVTVAYVQLLQLSQSICPVHCAGLTADLFFESVL